MDKRINQLINVLKEEVKLLITISIGVFIFILFFQPFPLDHFDFNNRLIFISGLSLIVFIIPVLTMLVSNLLFQKDNDHYTSQRITRNIEGAINWIAFSVAFAFYLHYVGNVDITFYLMGRILLITMVLPIVVKIHYHVKDLEENNLSLILEKKITREQSDIKEKGYLNQVIELVSENKSENLELQVSDLVIIKSADNYVEIIYREEDKIKKKLIRNTLKNIENQVKSYNFIRCHRTCILNPGYIEKMEKDYNNYWLTLNGIEEKIPVSRQYILNFKEFTR